MLGLVKSRLQSFPLARGWELRKLNRATTLPRLRYREVSRLVYPARMVDRIHHVEGDVVECGMGYGFSFVSLGLLVRAEMHGRKLWGF